MWAGPKEKHRSLTLCLCLTIFFSCLFRLASSFLFADKALAMLIPDWKKIKEYL